MPLETPTMEGVTFDHYEVLTRSDGSLHELGRGAMGITYKAFDKNLRVPVALKVINRQNLHDAAARERFVQEARSAALLRHQHVASVFHLGAEGETYFYAMEFIDGETVEALVKRRGPLPPVVVMRIGLQVARALSAAQQHGLVHRDIKPSNLMLLNAEGELCVKVIDFGLAMQARPEGEAGPSDEAAGSGGFMGTPHFASPEQLEERELDVRSDIYSLGATLWYLLTGSTLYSGPLRKVMRAHITEPPPWEKLRDVPTPVQVVLRRMLAKDPKDRPQTPAELRREIEFCLEKAKDAGMPVEDEEKAIAEETQQNRSRLPVAEFSPHQVVAGHLEIQRPLGETNEGWLFRALDRMAQRPVRLLALRHDFSEMPDVFSQLQREVERLAQAEHPNLLRIYGAEMVREIAVVTFEWTEGPTLREILRARRELAVAEAMALLKQMAGGVDYAVQCDVRQLDLGLHQVFLHLPAPPLGDRRSLLNESLTEWPSFTVKLNPLSIARELGVSETWAGGQTIVDDAQALSPGGGNLGTRYTRMLAALIYELLGGAAKPLLAAAGGTTRYTPLASLTEEGNEVLRKAIDPGRGFANATEFLRALETVDQLESRAHETHAGRSTTTGLLRESAAASAVLPPQKSRLPLIVGMALLVLIGLAIAILVRPRPATPEPARPTPELAKQEAEPTPTVKTEPVRPRPATPAPPPDPRAKLNAAVAEAERVEAGKDLDQSLAAWLAVARNFPDAEIGRMRLELLLDGVRLRQEKLPADELAHLSGSLEAAARMGVASAMLLLAESTLASDPVAAFQWYQAAAAKGVPSAMTQVGLMYSNGRGVAPDLAKAVEYFEQGAEKGDPAAQAALGECLIYGKGTKKDPARGIEILGEAASKGNVRAMNLLGHCYERGLGIEKNFPAAARLFQKAADKHFGEAMGNLGVLYMKGEGVEQSPRKAVELFLAGARENDPFCMFLYAQALEGGVGVAANAAEARSWYKRSAEAGFPGAIDWCKRHDVAFTPRNGADH